MSLLPWGAVVYADPARHPTAGVSADQGVCLVPVSMSAVYPHGVFISARGALQGAAAAGSLGC